MKLSDDVDLDLQRLVTTRLLLQANSGGGKSFALRRILEQSHGEVQQIVIDVEDEFYTLREKFDYILVRKEGGDCVPEVRSAALLAHRLLELGVSAIISIYEMKQHERIAFVKAFLDALVNAPKTLWHPALIVVDEAHVFCPEKEPAESAGSVIDLMTRGRKRGFCGILATQRISKLAKDAAAEANNKLIGRAALDVDMKRAGDEIGFVSKEDRLSLRQLKPGEFFAFGPAVSDVVIPVKVGPVQTTHPKAGAGVTPVAPPKHKVQSVLAQLADLPQQAEEQRASMESLKRANAELKRDLQRMRTSINICVGAAGVGDETELCGWIDKQKKHEPKTQIKEKPVLKDSQIDRLEKVHGDFLSVAKVIAEALAKVKFANTEPRSVSTSPAVAKRIGAPEGPGRDGHKPLMRNRTAASLSPTGSTAGDNFTITATQQRILDAIAWYESIGNDQPSTLQVGAIALIDATGGHFSNTVGPLSSSGLVVRGAGTISLTDEGRKYARLPEQISSLDDYHDMLRQRVRRAKSAGGKTVAMLDAIIQRGGADLTTEEIGQEVGIDHTGGHFSNTIGPLGTLGLIRRSHGVISPTEIIFPPGLS